MSDWAGGTEGPLGYQVKGPPIKVTKLGYPIKNFQPALHPAVAATTKA